MRGGAEIVKVGLVVEAHAFVEREPAAGGGAVEQASERGHRLTSGSDDGIAGIAPIANSSRQ